MAFSLAPRRPQDASLCLFRPPARQQTILAGKLPENVRNEDNWCRMNASVRSPLFEIAPHHRSEQEAREYVQTIAEKFGITNFKTKLATGKDATVPTSAKPLIVNLRKEVRQARITGVSPSLQGLIDNSDVLMPPPISLGVSMGGIAKIAYRIGNYSVSVDGDGILESTVVALSDDILFYRRQVVIDSEKHKTSLIARAYRTYLQVAISLVDAFLGHATFSLKQRNPRIGESEHFMLIQSTAPFEARIDAWCKLWNHPPEDFHRTKNWSDLSKLRTQRNRYVHPGEPIYSLGIDEIVNVLNPCRDGVGGTLEYFRKIAGLEPNLSYIQKIKTAPRIKKTG
jgi:hypothetical protein